MSLIREIHKSYDNVSEDFSESDLIKVVADEIRIKLRSKLKIMNKNAYKDSEMFLSHFLTRGGIIQAAVEPLCESSSGKKPV